MKKNPLQLSILATLSYSSIFEYPLTLDQIFSRLIGQFPLLTKTSLRQELHKETRVIEEKGYFALFGDEKLFSIRCKREQYALTKEHEVQLLEQILRRLPSISSAYVTGSQAMRNPSSLADDLDVLIVCHVGTLWMTRLCVVLWTSVIGKYRLHGGRGEYGWCFNLWLDRDHLTLPYKERNIYTAYEVIQARLFYGTQNELIISNPWINEYINYPSKTSNTKNYEALTKPDKVSVVVFVFKLLEPLAWIVQTVYMKPRKTTERVGRGFAFFHPRDTKGLILKAWKRKMRRIGLSEKEIREMEKRFEGT